MGFKQRAKESGEAFLTDMEQRVPMAYAMATSIYENRHLNESGEINLKSFVMLGFGGMVVAAFIPAAVTAINDVNTSAFTATQLAMWGMITIAIILAAVMVFVNLVS